MNLTRIRTSFVITAFSVTSVFAASTHTIGVASAVGTFSVNSATVSGNANLMDGSELKTTATPSQILLQNGSTLSLGTNSAGIVFSNRFVLEDGAARVDNLGQYTVSARGLSIKGDQSKAKASVSLTGNVLEVASLSGSLQILDAKGALLTRVTAGTSSTFKTNDPPTGASGGGGTTSGTKTAVIVAGATIAALAGAVAIAKVVDNNSTPTSP